MKFKEFVEIQEARLNNESVIGSIARGTGRLATYGAKKVGDSIKQGIKNQYNKTVFGRTQKYLKNKKKAFSKNVSNIRKIATGEKRFGDKS